MSKHNSVTTPKHLSAEGRDLYETTLREFPSIRSAMDCETLEQACAAIDRIRECQAILRKQGLVILDRNGISRPHPCTVIERNARSAYLAAYRSLGLEPPKL